MADVGIRELLEAGVHFGHQTRRWNPKMRRFIHGERDGIYIIDLLKTEALLRQALDFAGDVARRGGSVLFVGTKKQARDSIKQIAEESGMPYVNHRWLGGVLTNFQTISQRIKRLHDLERYETEGQLELLPTRERMAAQADLAKLRANLGGVKNMARLPQAVFVIDLKTEAIAVREAQRLRIPVIGLVDTNCDPDGIDFVIPGNDDAIKSCELITRALGDVIREGRSAFSQAEEERMRREAEEQARKQAEEQARAEAEANAAREAEQASADEAERRETLVKAEGDGDKQQAEAEVAEAVQAGGRRQPDPKVAPKANQDIATPDPPGQPPSPEPAPAAEADGPIVNEDVTDQAGVEPEPAEPQPDTEDAETPDTTETEKEKA